MQSTSVFLDIKQFDNFRRKNADVSRTQGVCHVMDMFFGSSLGKANCVKFHHCRLCMIDFWEANPHSYPLYFGLLAISNALSGNTLSAALLLFHSLKSPYTI